MPFFKDIENVNAISKLGVIASWDGWSPGSKSEEAVYNPPPGYVILDSQVHVLNNNNGSKSVSTLAAGLNLISEEEITRIYNDAIKVAGKYKDKDLAGQLSQERDERIHEVRKFQSNMNAILARVSAKAHGNLANRKRGWIEITVTARLLYLGSPDTDALKAELEKRHKINMMTLDADILKESAPSIASQVDLEAEDWGPVDIVEVLSTSS